MPLLKQTNQPFYADPNSPANRSCAGSYCYPIAIGDGFYQQWYQTPCRNSIVVDPTFSDSSLGANIVLEGTFPCPAAAWTFGGGWSCSGNAAAYFGFGAANLTQVGSGLLTGTLYYITFDITVGIGSMNVILGDPSGSDFTIYNIPSSGTYGIYMLQNDVVDQITFEAVVGGAVLTLDNVTCRPVTFTSWDTNGIWTLADDTACKSSTGTGNLVNGITDYILFNGYYKVVVSITSYTSGSLQVYIDDGAGVETNLQTAITANGTYTYYITPLQAGQIAFKPSSDFVGCISSPEVLELRRDYLFVLYKDDGDYWDISFLAEYYEDKVTFTEDIFSYFDLRYGCYYIEVTDRCLVEGTELVTNGDFGDGITGWSGGQGGVVAGAYEFEYDPIGVLPNIIVNGDFAGGAASWTLGAGWSIVGNKARHTPGSTATLSQTVTINPLNPPNIVHHWSSMIMSSRTAGYVTLSLSNASSVSQYNVNNEIMLGRFIPTIAGVVSFTITPSIDFDGDLDDFFLIETSVPWNSIPTIANVANANIVAGNYQLSYDITASTGSANIETTAVLLGQNEAYVWQNANGTYTTTLNNYTPGAQQVVIIADFTVYPGTITVDNISLVRIEPFEATYTTECLNYQESFENTKLFIGECDQNSFGFDFVNTGFRLQMRLITRSLSPIYKKNKNVAQFGTGDASVTYADSTKLWQVHTDFMSESAHDAMAVMVDSDHFSIGDSYVDAIEYIAEIDDYTPQWLQDGSYSLAPSIINLRLKTGGMKFNRHT